MFCEYMKIHADSSVVDITIRSLLNIFAPPSEIFLLDFETKMLKPVRHVLSLFVERKQTAVTMLECSTHLLDCKL